MRFLLSLSLALAIPGLATAAWPTSAVAQTSPVQRLSYGEDQLQAILYWPGARPDAPLVVFVHGGGWRRGDMSAMKGSDKLNHWQSQGYAVASVNYRLVPDATVEEQAADVAASLAYLKQHSERLGFDSGRIALAGHSAGAHLVSLVGTDPYYLRAARLDYSDLRGVLALDGAAYDVADQMDENPRLMGNTYAQAFGDDPARHRQLSPTFHAPAPNAPDFLILYVQRNDAQRQSRALGAALDAAGTPVQVQAVQGRGLRGHMQINRRLGDPDYPATEMVDRWLEQIFR